MGSCKMTRAERLFNNAHPEPNSGCWIWSGGTTSNGYLRYGAFSWAPGKQVRAHRASWMLFNGEIPGDDFVLHRCDNSLCVNPRHLYLGNQEINMRDMIIRSRGRNGFSKKDPLIFKLKRSDAKKIRLLSSVGATGVFLAKKFGVSTTVVSYIINKKIFNYPECGVGY